ncbi:UDP-glucose 4-epimerase [Micromonospora viridifaciens]|uniref:UDP-glucose 4-epimerase n=1 Tax=Micromonospora viridifaciens TaxID=1881 RepID=A0A1C4WZG4_MICVI|nr:NAD(P)-dependent oxidoreductase [Micromonospora viridifaciens]SCF01544.1 UDP-glucose 4-epimerase [Micromonospora viridifaciens]
MARVVVTGADGFVGKPLTVALADQGHTVLDLGPAYDVDVTDTDRVRARLSALAPDLIIHLAGVSGPMLHTDKPEVVMAVNAVGTVNILESARRMGGVRVMVAGSVSGYTTGTAQDPRPASVYGVTKRCAELLVGVYRSQFGMQCTAIRIGSVYGLGRKTAHVLDGMISRALAGEPVPFAPAGWEPLLHVSDAAALLAALCDVAAWREQYDLVTTPASHQTLAEMVCELSGSGSRPVAEDPPIYQWPVQFDIRPLLHDVARDHAPVALAEGIGQLLRQRQRQAPS